MPRTVHRGLAVVSTIAVLAVSVVGLTMFGLTMFGLSVPAGAEPSPTPSTTTSVTKPVTKPVTKTAVTKPVTAAGSSVPVPSVAAVGASGPNLGRAVHYLATTTAANGASGGTSLARNGYYEAFPPVADFGLTIDGAFALAAAGTDNQDLRTVVDLFRHDTADGAGNTADSWTGIGTAFASGGSVGKEAVLAEVTGYDPRNFGGHDLIAALDHLVCRAATGAPDYACAAAGNYEYATSTFSQSLGVIAQLRAGDVTGAGRAVSYLESLQNRAGAWPSLLPSSGDSDVDSTAMAAMALALLPHDAVATAAVGRASAWLAGRQQADGGFTGAAGESANSTGLAVQGLLLAGSRYSPGVARARHFLANQQNPDGGFQPSTTAPPGSDVRASAQAVSGAVGISFATLSDDIADSAVTPSTAATTSRSSAVASTRIAPSAGVKTSAHVTTSAGVTTVGSTAPVVRRTAALASTGLDTAGLLGYGLALVVAGGGLVVAARRRSATAVGRHR